MGTLGYTTARSCGSGGAPQRESFLPGAQLPLISGTLQAVPVLNAWVVLLDPCA